MRSTNWPGVIVAVLGLVFLIFDLGSDAWLAYQYWYDRTFYSQNSTRNINSFLYEDWNQYLNYNISKACEDQYLCSYEPTTSIVPTQKCKEEIYEEIGFNPPHHQLGAEDSALFMYLTIAVLLLGGVLQTGIALFSCYKRNNFWISPKLIKVITVVACLILLGPVVLYLYIIFRSVKGANDEEVTRYKPIVGNLKFAEVHAATYPQYYLIDV